MFDHNKLNFELSLEDQLLIYCARTRINRETEKKIFTLTSQELDWDYLIKMASQHKIIPLFYINLNKICPQNIPNHYLNSLRQKFHGNIRKNLLLTAELINIIRLLEENGVHTFTYKGPVLAHSVYGNISYRQFSDIDIFIEKSDALKAKNIMLSNGYNLDPPIKVKDSTYLKLDVEYRFRGNSGALIEINWNFAGSFFYLPKISEFLYQDLNEIEINNFPIYIPTSTNLLLMLCIHCAKHNWNKLSWICDISEFIMIKEIDWNETLEKAQILGLERILFITLIIVKQFYNIKIPPKILEQFEQNDSLKSTSFNVIQYLFKNRKLTIFRKLYLDLKKRDILIDGIKDSIYGLTNPTYADFKEVKIPLKLFFFYHVIRPFLLIKRYGLKSIS